MPHLATPASLRRRSIAPSSRGKRGGLESRYPSRRVEGSNPSLRSSMTRPPGVKRSGLDGWGAGLVGGDRFRRSVCCVTVVPLIYSAASGQGVGAERPGTQSASRPAEGDQSGGRVRRAAACFEAADLAVAKAVVTKD